MQKAGCFNGCRANDNVGNAVIEIAFNGFEVAYPTPKLSRDFIPMAVNAMGMKSELGVGYATSKPLNAISMTAFPTLSLAQQR